ncbi:hypothetical protein FRC12_008696 [Ceratobasidium sp. 428]|nr:hypothetical protein FRC12_008696 [Ceratobasidium sp. 428]
MPSDEDKIPAVTLSGFIFADQQVPPNQPLNEKQSTKDAKEYTHVLGAQPGFEFRRPEAYERMAGDKLGQELAHDATIWKLYLEEANEHDQELVNGRHASLDMLLLFAALFSAILTAFLIESKDLLQQDPADASLILLLSIAQSQYRIEKGEPFHSTADSLPSIPDFSPPMSARLINGIWFTSLGLSLSAALIAMLGKEWLTAFLASRPRPTHSHALLRQSRLEGLERWWALHIIALLPSLLHASLFLFSVGLVLYLWTLDEAIAMVLAAIVGVTSLFYILTAVLGAVYEFCPFVTELSGYVRRATVALVRRDQPSRDTTSKYPTLKDMQALLWLANHARDPAVVNCSYQALSGLRCPTDLNTNPVNQEGSSSPPEALAYDLPMQLDSDSTLNSVLGTIVERFEKLTTGSLDLENPDISAARYLNAITSVSSHIRRLSNISFADPGINLGRQNLGPIGEEGIRTREIHIGLPVPPFQVLGMIENLWSNKSASLSANTYASILISTMEVIQLVVLTLPHVESSKTGLLSIDPLGAPSKSESGVESRPYTIDMTPMSLITTEPTSQLVSLRACYSQWLIRVSTLICMHTQDKITISPYILKDLFDAITIAARVIIPVPVHTASSFHQIGEIDTRSYRMTFGWDLLGVLSTSLLNVLASRMDPQLRLYGPLQGHTQHWLQYYFSKSSGLERDELLKAFDLNSWQDVSTVSDMIGVRFVVARQSLLTVRYLGLAQIESVAHFSFLEDALNLVNVCYCQDTYNSHLKDSYWVLAHHCDDLLPILELVGQSDSKFRLLTELAKFDLIDCCRVGGTQGATACDGPLTPNCFPPLIRMIGQTENKADKIEQLLCLIIRRMRATPSIARLEGAPWNDVPAIEYLRPFTHTPWGFSALYSASTNRDGKHAKLVTKAIIDIVHLATGRDPSLPIEPIQLLPDAVPSFLNAISVVTEHVADLENYEQLLIQFSSDVLELMKAAIENEESKERMREHSVWSDIWQALKDVEGDDTTDVVARFVAVEVELGITLEDAPLGDSTSRGEADKIVGEVKSQCGSESNISRVGDEKKKPGGDEDKEVVEEVLVGGSVM